MVSLQDAHRTAPEGAPVERYQDWGEQAGLIALATQNSPYLARLVDQHGAWIFERRAAPVKSVISDIKDDVKTTDLKTLGESLRHAKARMALYLALLDLGRALDVLDITHHLSVFADFSVQISLDFLLEESIKRHRLPPSTKERMGLFVLAMGKGGAYELNYSSDIDLILFYDADVLEGDDFDDRKAFIRMAQSMVKLLSENTKDGYVFRTDLRLRPDPAVTPVVISSEQALGYYELLGRTWERAAYIKARVSAGDHTAGEAFLREMHPFVWRKHLDFAAIEDAHNMRLRIRAHKGLEGAIRLEGHDLKLGRGGIREIEFFTQTRQLIFGGRDASLRLRATCDSLDALADAAIIERELADYLKSEYLWLRQLEHAVQMIDDCQTHRIPEGENLERFLNLIGASSRADFEAEFVRRVSDIDDTMERFFAGSQPDEEDAFDFDEAEGEMIETWLSLPALRSDRARGIFSRLRPQILKRLHASANPQDALKNFDRFLRGLPSGVQLFSLFEANPALLDLLADICALAPNEAKLLGQNHRIFEAVLSPEFFVPLRADDQDRLHFREHCEREIKGAEDYEDRLNGIRRFVREAQFRVSVHLLLSLSPMDVIGKSYSIIADTALEALYPAVKADVERRYGQVLGRGMVVLALGKLGSREMTRSSDLDLVMIYDAQGQEYSDGKRALSASQYFSRFTQNFIQALSVATSEGALYEVDMRLRPSGRQGPVAVSLQSFADYQMNEAWTWEHMALLRARVVAGDQVLGQEVMQAAAHALAKKHDKQKIRQDVFDMREKIRENFAQDNERALKYGAGRQMETELMIQGFALLAGMDHAGNSMKALLEASRGLVRPSEYHDMSDALEFYGGLTQLARLSFDGVIPSDPPKGWIERQSDVSGASSMDALIDKLATISHKMTMIFDQYYGDEK